jgi:hypothetical protein
MKISINDVISILDEMDMLRVRAEGVWPTNWSESVSEYPVDWKKVLEPRLPNPDEDLLPGDEWREVLDDEWREVLDDEWREVLDDLESGAGGEEHTPEEQIIDVLAWYQPIHYHGREWGIYIYESAIVDTAKSIISYLPYYRRYQPDAQVGALRSAFRTLFLHEVFHHKVESFAIMLEVIGRKDHYVPYTESVYRPLRGTDDLIEEGLACAEMKTRLREPTYSRDVPDDVRDAAQRMLEDWIPRLPPGYRTGCDFLEKWAFERARDHLSAQIQEASTAPARNPNELKLAGRAYQRLLDCKKATRLVVPVGLTPRIPWF